MECLRTYLTLRMVKMESFLFVLPQLNIIYFILLWAVLGIELQASSHF
jgi:uncharacterized membrane protein YraQ (UPF0718 family)